MGKRGRDGGASDLAKRSVKSKVPRKVEDEILQQFEFWFSEPNMRRDRVLRKISFQGDANGTAWVPLETFLKFNKVKEWGTSVDEMVDVCRKSSILEVSPDLTRVRRKTAIQLKSDEEADAATVYIENLGVSATHSAIYRQFSTFGSVAYVSLPHWQLPSRPTAEGSTDKREPDQVDKPKPPREPRQIAKGFCFLEFDSVKAAKQCLAHHDQGLTNLRVVSKTNWIESSEKYKDKLVFSYPENAVVVVDGLLDEPLTSLSVDKSPSTSRSEPGVLQRARIIIQESAEAAAGPVAFVDYSPEREAGVCKIRFFHPHSAARFISATKGGQDMPGLTAPKRPSCRLLSGDDQVLYWREVEKRRQTKAATQLPTTKPKGRNSRTGRPERQEKKQEAVGSHVHFEE